ncbi:MAG: DUF3006 domain-containing protein [Halanaeroarchaeum sp.]
MIIGYIAAARAYEEALRTPERDGEEVGNAVLAASRLPADARRADAILSVTLADGAIEAASYDPERTATRAEAAQDRFDRLSKRPQSDGDA